MRSQKIENAALIAAFSIKIKKSEEKLSDIKS
jgi:hypothetical protein